MPFLRIVRDKRGYEYLSLVQQTSGRRGKVRQQLLYWFRTPPNIRVGRQALDEDVVRVLEAQNPDVQFDWDALRETPPLPPSAEPWRERRRAERAARQLPEGAEAEPPGVDPSPGVRDVPLDAHDGLEDETRVESPMLVGDTAQVAFMAPDVVTETITAMPPVGTAGSDAMRRRRPRRRGRRGPSDGPANTPGLASTPSEGAASTPTESPAPSSTGHEQTAAPGEEE